MGKKLTTDGFIEKARLIHGDKYDYSLIPDNIKSTTYADIICPDHGVFNQRLSSHITAHKSGCRKCYFESIKGPRTSFADFLMKATAVHGTRYIYSEVNHGKSRDVIPIYCNKHGYFHQKINSHLNGCGCPSCGDESLVGLYRWETLLSDTELASRECIVYEVEIEHMTTNEVFSKFGITCNSVKDRFKSIKPYKLKSSKILYSGRLIDCFEVEQLLLSEVRELGIGYTPKENFQGRTECFRETN